MYGKTTRVPNLWIYSGNDSYFSSSLVKEMHEAFQQSGGKAQLVMLPPFGKDGHYFFSNNRGLPLGTEVADKFLAEIGLLTTR